MAEDKKKKVTKTKKSDAKGVVRVVRPQLPGYMPGSFRILDN